MKGIISLIDLKKEVMERYNNPKKDILFGIDCPCNCLEIGFVDWDYYARRKDLNMVNGPNFRREYSVNDNIAIIQSLIKKVSRLENNNIEKSNKNVFKLLGKLRKSYEDLQGDK